MINANSYRSLSNELNSGKKGVMVTILQGKGCDEKAFSNKTFISEENLNNSNYTSDMNKIPFPKALFALESGNLQYIKGSDNETCLIEPYYPEPHLIVFGGGHIAKPLVEFGTKLGFLVTVIDDRPTFANKSRFPEAEKVICESFEKCFNFINLNKATFVVIVTRGHRHDMDCLKQVLMHKTAYVGMIGSKRRVKSVMEILLSEGYSQESLDKINAPIGLDIGAITPEEIAVSIIAQVISYKRLINKAKGASPEQKVNWPELDREVLEELSQEKDEPKAIITVVATKGSVPRKAGAKMLVWTDGRVLGSIGGGCSEGEVIITARDVIREGLGGYMDMNIDMTGQIAEDEGMVCGGTMQVVIEAI